MKKNIYLLIVIVLMLLSQILGCAASIVGGPIPRNVLKDGTYDGIAKQGPVKVIAKVTIKNQSIARIELIKHRTWRGKAAEKIIPQKIIDEQSTNVDAVSGATISSRVIMNAVEAAIQKAK
jgi:NosR/NirI family nitrous oxide reductase transcriptional regulator